MRMSNLFGRTQREVPAEAELVSHRLALRAGLIRPLAAGIYSYLPLGWRVLQRIEQIMRQEMDAIGGQEINMPVVNPAELWQATGRYQAPAPGAALVRFQDRTEHDLVLAMTHEEVVADLLRQEIRSYRQLPLMIYHIQTKFRDEPRPRGGLVRAREFTMKDAYSCHTDAASLDEYYPQMYEAYVNIFARCGVQAVPVPADSGVMGGSTSHEFMLLSEQGEDTLALCPACGYAANLERATFRKQPRVVEPPAPMEEISTPDTRTIAELCQLLGITADRTLKALFYTTGEGEVVMAVIRGDLEANLTKLSNALGGAELRLSTDEELTKAGIVAGYASPIGLNLRVVGDDSLTPGSNWVAGANRAGYHLRNVNYPRDFQVTVVADIAAARSGDACPECGAPLSMAQGIEAGHLFKLGTRYSEALGARFLDRDGQSRPVVMGSYGIGTGRLMQGIIEQNHDEHGIIWPPAVAPYQVHLVALGMTQPEVVQASDELYARLVNGGFEVLYDERDESAGVKFNDADLIGLPWRITVSRKTVAAQSVELKGRRDAAPRLLAASELENALSAAGIVPRKD